MGGFKALLRCHPSTLDGLYNCRAEKRPSNRHRQGLQMSNGIGQGDELCMCTASSRTRERSRSPTIREKEISHVPRSPSNYSTLPPSNQIVSFAEVLKQCSTSADASGCHWKYDTWGARMAALTTRDLLLMHREWLSRTAVLLLPAEAGGPGSYAHNRLMDLNAT